MVAIHPWWASFGVDVANAAALTPAPARDLAALVTSGDLPGVTLLELREAGNMKCAAVGLQVDVERPQDLAHPIRAVEPIAVFFPFDGGQPSVLALREDFPDTPHQNWTPPDMPSALCIDDRPWAEAHLTATAPDIVRRIQLWLAKAARGDLHDLAQPPDPLFYASDIGLVIPASVLVPGSGPVELAGYVRGDNEQLILTHPIAATDQPFTMTILAFHAQPRGPTRLRHAPRTLAALAAELEACGIKLYDELKSRLKTWTGFGKADIRRLSGRLAIVVAFPVATGEQQGVNDVRAFLTCDPAGEIGTALGVLAANVSGNGNDKAYVALIAEGQPSQAELKVEPVQVHFALDRALATTIAGIPTADMRRVVLIGAGSLGSQLSLNLAREGRFVWTVVDQDYILPHNLVRHALFAREVGAPKAAALADKLAGILAQPVPSIGCNVLHPDEAQAAILAIALAGADIILDVSASVAVARRLSDVPDSKARRICAFFNPAGTAVVVLAEDMERRITIRDLEAQYHRLALTEPGLTGHLDTQSGGVRYSGSCRALTNKIPASNAALLSALAAIGCREAADSKQATVAVWTHARDRSVQTVRRNGSAVKQASMGDWSISYDADLHGALRRMREEKLPAETGGVLLGIVDTSRKSIHIAHALPPPEDSRGDSAAFERGIVELSEQVRRAAEASMHQLRYVGEWHSHPDRASVMPSTTDLSQLLWLRQELAREGLPALIAIAGDNGQLALVSSSAPARSAA